MRTIMDITTLLIMGLLSFGLGGCSNAQNKQEYSNVKEIGNVPKENVDSYVYKNEGRPVYYAKYGNRGCLFELRVNDILITEITYPTNIGEALITVNPAIFKSGKQTIEVHLSPIKGEEVISNAKPFRLEIGYYDSTEEVDESGEATWHTVFTLPDIEIPEKGLPYIDMRGEFEANVPYQYTYWDDCVDLRTIPDIEQKIVKEYEYVRKLIAQKNLEQLKKYFMPSYREFAITIYQTKEDIDLSWNNTCKLIKKYSTSDLQPIEEYRIVFSSNGRSVSLRSNKYGGFPSALVFVKEVNSGAELECGYIELHLGMKKGTDKLIPLMI